MSTQATQLTFADELREITRNFDPTLSVEESKQVFRTRVKKMCLITAKQHSMIMIMTIKDKPKHLNPNFNVETMENIFQDLVLKFRYDQNGNCELSWSYS